ncbi:hypothetical protein RJ55_05356 [Drechmeria coniospora]|nr:hypothetical protein RJ55_05356 [Drechmeria coniospora]
MQRVHVGAVLLLPISTCAILVRDVGRVIVSPSGKIGPLATANFPPRSVLLAYLVMVTMRSIPRQAPTVVDNGGIYRPRGAYTLAPRSTIFCLRWGEGDVLKRRPILA